MCGDFDWGLTPKVRNRTVTQHVEVLKVYKLPDRNQICVDSDYELRNVLSPRHRELNHNAATSDFVSLSMCIRAYFCAPLPFQVRLDPLWEGEISIFDPHLPRKGFLFERSRFFRTWEVLLANNFPLASSFITPFGTGILIALKSDVQSDPIKLTNQYPNLAQCFDPINSNLYTYDYRSAGTRPNGMWRNSLFQLFNCKVLRLRQCC